MRALNRIVAGFTALVHRRRAEQDLDDELQQFFDEAVAANLQRGLTRAQAERAARIELGNAAAVKDWTSDAGWESRLESVWQDVRYAARVLRRSRGFATVASLTIAAGIGTNLAIFTLADGMLFRGLPYDRPGELVLIQGFDVRRGQPYNRVPRIAFENLQQHTGLAGVATAATDAPLTWLGPEGLEAVTTAFGTPNLFQILRVKPFLGRLLEPGDESAEPRPVMLTFDSWRGRFGSDPAVLGRITQFAQRAVQVVGVLPPRFMLPAQGALAAGEVVYLKTLDRGEATNPRAGVWSPVARLKPGVTVAEAQTETDVLVARVARQLSSGGGDVALRVEALQVALFEQSRPVLWLLVGAAGGVLLIACVNFANLLLARGATREREIGIRLSLGASRWRVARQLLAESATLGILAAAVALAAGGVVGIMLAGYVPPRFQLRPSVFEWRTIGLLALMSVGVSCLFGAVPALRLASADPNGALREPRRTGEGRSFRAGPTLVAVEVALALVLLAGTAVTAASLIRLRTADLGFEHTDAAVLSQGLPQARYPTPRHAFDFQMRIVNELRKIPGVSASGIDVPQVGSALPMRALADGTAVWSVLPGYFGTLGIPLVEGRDFVEAELDRAADVAVVSESFARGEWPGQSAVGQLVAREGEPPATVVGVAGDVRSGYGAQVTPAVYRLLSAQTYRRMTVVARRSGDPATLPALMRTVIGRLDSGLVVPSPRTVADVLFFGIRDSQFQTTLFALFGFVGLTVAAAGIYGVMAYWVNSRTRDFGIRVALGAAPGRLKRSVVLHAALPLVAGLAAGLAGAFALMKQLGSVLYGIEPQDFGTTAMAVVALLGVGLAAAYVPARRAARVDPIIALRAD